ncbi:hypothetical protein AB7M49_000866 [Bradyrhizobium elkanii]|jgi:hypothetical protein|uniref:Uncharacterized protein n=1 Tax=Bradyrhizobium elkanii TaxID=29448 RepID=A0A8I1YDE2_BRAEL|nr:MULTISPECIES: hypothetical protein [Bradyrhizobium]MBP1294468.1 hypothetical protein [Bradyrhizobium elkanii]MCP1925148.1 hypothetical protein [Bradyrhizobium elkanii]MCP1966930.1 hypothetical protein [Bradyrhizobium elkanii]MCS3447408.1 hypothetical protein [Bradyrhizobium elkanii]MCS3477363.1 hypothetical protein [Bradyrhizobium elkanii]
MVDLDQDKAIASDECIGMADRYDWISIACLTAIALTTVAATAALFL